MTCYFLDTNLQNVTTKINCKYNCEVEKCHEFFEADLVRIFQ